MATKIERMNEVCERRQRETGGHCIEECMGIGWCSEVYAGVTAGRDFEPRQDTLGRRYFLKTYLPFLREVAADPEKVRFCSDAYDEDSDPWGLYERVYQSLMPDAYAFGFVPRDYADIEREIEAMFGPATGRRLDEGSLQRLTDRQVVGMVALLVRGDYFEPNYLINHSVASGDLLYYLEELDRRW